MNPALDREQARRQMIGVGSLLAGDSHLGIASRFDKLKALSGSKGKLASYRLHRSGLA